MNAPAQGSHLRVVHDDSDERPRIPPHDLDSEVAVISAALISPDTVARVPFLTPAHFYSEAHRWIWRAILEVASQSPPAPSPTTPAEEREAIERERVCIVRVGTWLKAHDRIAQVGGMAYITEILNGAPAVANVIPYAVTVYDRARVREALALAQRFEARCYLERGVDPYGEAQPFLDEIARDVARIARKSPVSRFETNSQTLQRIIAEITRRANGEAKADDTGGAGIPTGFARVDQLTRGLRPGEKIVVVALPKVGKSAWVAQVAVHVAKQGIGVLVLSQELPREEWMARALACEARVSFDKFRTGALSSPEWARLLEAVKLFETLPIYIDDTPAMNIDMVRASVVQHIDRARAEYKKPLGLYVLDYIQRLDRAPHQQGTKEHEYLADAAKLNSNIARELKLACLEVAQRKAVDIDRQTKVRPKPTPGCTAQSSQIEREAHAVVYLYRNPLYVAGRIDGEDATSVTMVLGLQRGGAEGVVRFEYTGPEYRFTCIDPPEIEQGTLASASADPAYWDQFKTDGEPPP